MTNPVSSTANPATDLFASLNGTYHNEFEPIKQYVSQFFAASDNATAKSGSIESNGQFPNDIPAGRDQHGAGDSTAQHHIARLDHQLCQ